MELAHREAQLGFFARNHANAVFFHSRIYVINSAAYLVNILSLPNEFRIWYKRDGLKYDSDVTLVFQSCSKVYMDSAWPKKLNHNKWLTVAQKYTREMFKRYTGGTCCSQHQYFALWLNGITATDFIYGAAQHNLTAIVELNCIRDLLLSSPRDTVASKQ